MPGTTITAIRATPVTVPLEAPLRHGDGTHRGRFVMGRSGRGAPTGAALNTAKERIQ